MRAIALVPGTTTGVASLEFNLLDALAIDGVYVLTGVPGGDRPLQIPGANLIRQLVLKNQVMVGSVNAARAHFQMAVADLSHAALRWGVDYVARLINHRYNYQDFDRPLHEHGPNDIKVVIEWSDPVRCD